MRRSYRRKLKNFGGRVSADSRTMPSFIRGVSCNTGHFSKIHFLWGGMSHYLYNAMPKMGDSF